MSDTPSIAGAALHPMAPEHLPYFILAATGEGGMMGTALVLLVLGVMAFGVFYLHLHSLPERLAHATNRTQQWQLVAILALVALFTNENIFWLAALLFGRDAISRFSDPYHLGHPIARCPGQARLRRGLGRNCRARDGCDRARRGQTPCFSS